MEYIKKPTVIEAFKYDGDLKGSDGQYYVPEWAVEAFQDCILFYKEYDGHPMELFIRTLKGSIYHVHIGDYIIKGINGELYPCNPDIFEEYYELYELADERASVNAGLDEERREDKQKILDLLLPALQATSNLNDLVSLTYLNEARFEGVKAEFKNGTKYANTAIDSGTSMIRDVLNQII